MSRDLPSREGARQDEGKDPPNPTTNRLSGASDEALLTAIGRGDQPALAVLYDRYGGLAYGLAYRVLGDRGAAEDVVQGAFLSVWRRASRFGVGRGSVRTRLLALVHQRALGHSRGTAEHDRRGEWDEAPALDDPWREVETAVLREALERGLTILPEEQRRTIALAYFDGCTQTEIAGLTGAPLSAVRGRMRLGLHGLRALLAEMGGASAPPA